MVHISGGTAEERVGEMAQRVEELVRTCVVNIIHFQVIVNMHKFLYDCLLQNAI
jgi:hypothetical protein